MLVECLSVGRGTTLPSNPTGGVKLVTLATGAHAYIRRQFGVSIGKMEGIGEPLARTAGNAYIIDAAVSLVTYGITLGEEPAILSVIVKYHCTHRGQQSIIDVMNITGGKGIMFGQSSFLAHAYQGVPTTIIIEGANILARSMMTFKQEAIRRHPYVLEEMEAAKNNGVNAFDRLLSKHIGYVDSSKVRSSWLGLARGLTNSTSTGDAAKRYCRYLNRLSASLALLSDVSMAMLGGGLRRRKCISTRLGDTLSQLYFVSIVLKRYDDEGCNGADLSLVHQGAQDALYRAEQTMDDLPQNFPNRMATGLLNVMIFPTGCRYLVPSDRLGRKVARILQVPNATHSRIGRGQYLTPGEHNPTGLLEKALVDIIAADPIHQRVRKESGENLSLTRLDKLAHNVLAKGLVGRDGAVILVKAEESRLHSINVGDFDPKELATKPTELPERMRKVETA